MWRDEKSTGNESEKIKYEIVPYTRGLGLDLGCGMWKTYPHFIGVDNKKSWQGISPADQYALRLSVDVECDCTKLEPFANQSMDFVFSSHLLEHMKDPLASLKEWWRVIKHNGFFVLYLPHKDFYPNVGAEGASPDHVHDFKPEDIIKYMKEVGCWDLIRNENRSTSDDNEYSFLQVYKKRSDKQQLYSYMESNVPFIGSTKIVDHKIVREEKKTCGVVRYGGFGDMIQTSSILPHLKNQGYHITVFTTPRGHDILEHDPHVDEFLIQDTDQVPNEELIPYWDCWKKKFDKWINLSESVEGTFLALPGRTFYMWPWAARHRLLNVNYLEFMHTLASVPIVFNPQFYPTEKEKRWAQKQRNKIHGTAILWVLDGSAVHKHWPWMDNAFGRILTSYDDVKIVTVGNELSSLLEMGWENESRILKKCGKWSIRQTLAFAQTADVIIGPETGVMNAVSMLDMPKILFLSHSSPENLSKHWNNCYPLTTDHGCRTCHKMHYGWEHCSRKSLEYEVNDKVLIIEGAECQINITLAQFWSAFTKAIEFKKAA